jgi:hypothetical protein
MTPDRDRLAAALREQGLDPTEVAAALPAVAALAGWEPMPPTSGERDRLLAALARHLPRPSPARAAVAARHRSPWTELAGLVRMALAQATILRAGFWAGSAAVMLVGVLLAANVAAPDRALVLELAGPLLAYLGTALGFRGTSIGVLEFELACPVSPRQLTVARLLIIVGYQALVGLALSSPLPAWGLRVTLLWLAPLLVATGLTLLLSLWLPVTRAAGFVAVAWVAAAVVIWRAGASTLAASLPAEATLAVAGLVLLGAAVAWLPAALPRLLPARDLRTA